MKDEIKEILEYVLSLTYGNENAIKGINKVEDYITNLQEENDYLKDIVSNTELSDEIKKADKWSKRELYKINYQRLKANQRLQEENEKLKEKIGRLEDRLINRRTRIDKAINILKLSSQNKGICTRPETDTIQSALKELQGSDKDE